MVGGCLSGEVKEGVQEGWRKKADLKDAIKNKVSFCSKLAISG